MTKCLGAGRVSSAALAGTAHMTLIVALKSKHWSLAKVSGLGMSAVVVFDALALWFHSIQLASLTCCIE